MPLAKTCIYIYICREEQGGEIEELAWPMRNVQGSLQKEEEAGSARKRAEAVDHQAAVQVSKLEVTLQNLEAKARTRRITTRPDYEQDWRRQTYVRPPPCGTSSRAREIALAGRKAPRPLRAAGYADGLPDLVGRDALRIMKRKIRWSGM